MIERATWYQMSKMEKDAGLKENLLVAALTSLLMIPFDLAALHWAKKLGKTPQEIGQAITPDIWEQAKQLISQRNDNPEAASLIDVAKAEGEKALQESKKTDEKPVQEVDLTKWAGDIDIVAKTLYGEGRNQSESARKDLASVIWERAKGDTSKLKTECLKPKQFSCWNNGPVVVDMKKESKVWQACLNLAKTMFNGSFTPTIIADHYWAARGPWKLDSPPYWADTNKFVDNRGDHDFYKLN